MSDFFSFRLPEDFVEKYISASNPFGFKDAGENSLGEITFIRTYSRMKEDGTKERWHEVCRRVIEGMIQYKRTMLKRIVCHGMTTRLRSLHKKHFRECLN